MSDRSAESVGRLIAQALSGAWRAIPPALKLEPEELALITPRLLGAGVAGLAWRRLRNTDLSRSGSASELRRQYESITAQAVLNRQSIESVIQALHAADVKPLLVKGHAAARAYPDEGLRPYVDVDLCVAETQFEAATAALKTTPGALTVDLHRELVTLGGGNWEDIYSRSEVMRLGETEVRVPKAEDHLRILAVHLLREGAWRPLWLCDVAAAAESRPAKFDWHLCTGSSPQTSNWIHCALKLAYELLGADISGTPAARDEKPLPRWLTRTVLREWGAITPSMSLRHKSPMARHLRSPNTLANGFRNRWPNAIEGTVVSRGLFNDLPRFPFQFKAYMIRGAHFAKTLLRPD